MPHRQIEYFYSAHSAYAYIGSAKLLDICRTHHCRLVHKPISLSPVVEAAGSAPFDKRTADHIDYYFGREIERWAEYRSVPIIDHRPTHHDNPLDLSNGMIIAAGLQGLDVDAIAHAILRAHWVDDIDLADKAALAHVAKSLGINAEPLLAAALSPEVQEAHAENTQQAINRHVFGSPTYFVDGDMFYGQDHLDLVERALKKPFPPPAFKNPVA